MARDNLDAFCGMWSTIVEDVVIILMGTQTTRRQSQQAGGKADYFLGLVELQLNGILLGLIEQRDNPTEMCQFASEFGL